MCDPDIELRSAVVPALAPKTYRGLDEMVRWRENLAVVMEDVHFEDSQFLDAGRDHVVHLYRLVGRGAGSGVPVNREIGALWQLRNGKLLKGEVYLDQREALEAAGLSE
jgi:ketosteroid isomerase-like protein